MTLLETMSLEEMKSAAHQIMPLIRAAAHRGSDGSG
jgi:hypothetical protein